MTVVVGTAGHIDHGKTALLRALTGIDADRLPEERRRGMTIDVGYAHLALPDGTELDFVDVPGHDRLVGNMLVGAGEIDAAMLVVAADDGPRAQTIEHLDLLDALGVGFGVAVVTKVDLAPADRVEEVMAAVRRLLDGTTLAGSPVLAVSATTGAGLDELRAALLAVRDRVEPSTGLPRLAIDRVFSVRGRGAVVTGTLRGGPIAAGEALRVVPGGFTVRVREVQVHGRPVDRAFDGRTALNLAGVESAQLRRGLVLTTDPAVVASDRLLVALRPRAHGSGHGVRVRLHLGAEQVGAVIGRSGRERVSLPGGEDGAILRLEQPVATAPGDRFVLRDPAARSTAAGGRVLDPQPPRGVSRRRLTPERVTALAAAPAAESREAARLEIHGVVGNRAAADVAASLAEAALRAVADHHAAEPESSGIPLPEVRATIARTARRLATLDAGRAAGLAGGVIAGLVASGRLVQAGDRLRDPARAGGRGLALDVAMARLEAALAVPAPPPFAEAVRAAACPPEGVRALETSGRIVRLDEDLAYAASTLRAIEERALAMASRAPVTPAALRDATGTSRRYVLAILEDLDRRGALRRTPAGHVPGPRTPVAQ